MSLDNWRASVMRHFRRSRMREFERMFHLNDSSRVLDLGGTRFNWDLIAAKPQIKMINIEGETGRFGNIEMLRGDATDFSIDGRGFDVVYSNSVIEHVGDWSKMQAYAENVGRLAPRYYVQTPNKWFPIEPHCIGLFLHWFPFGIRRRLYRWISAYGWRNRPSQQSIDRHLSSIRLLTKSELKRLFPDARLLEERTWLFPFVAKSFILVRGADVGNDKRRLAWPWASPRRRTTA